MLIFSGMVMIQRYPFTAAVRAMPIPAGSQKRKIYRTRNVLFCTVPCKVPVLPEVGSMIVSPGLRIPALSASSTIRRPILSFTLPPALKNSHLATRDKRQTQIYSCLGGFLLPHALHISS